MFAMQCDHLSLLLYLSLSLRFVSVFVFGLTVESVVFAMQCDHPSLSLYLCLILY